MFASKDTLLTRPSGGYNIARSVRLRSSASAYLNRTPSVASSSSKYTVSMWVKLGAIQDEFLFGAGASTANQTYIRFYSGGSQAILWETDTSSTTNWAVQTNAVYRDPSAWYHLVFAYDSSLSGLSNQAKIYVNGVQASVTTSGSGTNSYVNTTVAHYIGRAASTTYFDGYITEAQLIDGQALTPSSFGSTNAITGVWQPAKYTGTYGTNGFYLNFSDNSNNTAATIGKDYSGNGNNWTPNNISVTAGATYDSMTDVPTLTSATAGNYCVMNPLNLPKGGTLSNGNLLWTSPSAEAQAVGTMYVSSGKFYWEMISNTSGGCAFGIASNTTDINNINLTAGSYVYYTNGNKYNGGTGSAYGATFTNGDLIGIALDLDAGTLVFYKNNTSQGTAFTGLSGTFTALIYEGTSASSLTFDANFGQRPFTYTPPTGFVALNTYNLPASTITNGAAYMAATTYTGTGASLTVANTVNGIGFQPDFVWAKNRTNAIGNALFDSVRGTGLQIVSNSTGAETNEGSFGVSAFNSNGFNVGANSSVNQSSASIVGWQWKAGGTSASNTNGSITSTVSVGATQGFSVVTYTGNSTNNATVGHGLGVVPSMIILKNRSGAYDWPCYHTSIGSGGYVYLNSTAAKATDANMWKTTPTSTVFTLGTYTENNGSANNYVAYCFSAVAGYSAFGSYTGNGSNQFVYLGFRPRFVMVKSTSAGQSWIIQDSTINSYNVTNAYLLANSSAAEGSGVPWDYLSNGFRLTTSSANDSGQTFIYMAFAENPFKNALAR